MAKLEIPPLEKTGRPEFGLIFNQFGVTDIGAQIEMLKEISAKDCMGYIGSEKKRLRKPREKQPYVLMGECFTARRKQEGLGC